MRRIVSSSVAVIASTVCAAFLSAAPAWANETVMVCDVYGDQIAPQASAVYGIGTSVTCPGDPNPGTYTETHPPGGMAIWTGPNTISQGTSVHWTVSAPAGMTIAGVYIPHMYSHGIDDGTGWGGGFFWNGGNTNTFDGETGWSSANVSWPAGGSPYFGWQVVCGASQCTNGGNQWLTVELLELNVQETTGPYLTAPDGLWAASGWIRGSWPIHFYGDSPSGLCSLAASLNGQTVASSSVSGNSSVWHQCSSPAVNQAVNTANYGQGALPLTISALDSANQPVSYSKTVDVDNAAPTISLSGPTDAASTAGTQYIAASATAGPSGVAGIHCSLDNAPSQLHAVSQVQIPVSGVGVHHLSCYSENNARDTSGTPATSSTASWTISIRTPSVSSVSFARIADALRCASRHERVRIPAHWVTATYKGHPVRVRLPAQVRTVKVVHCHARIVRRRVRIHGRWRAVRAVVLPHEVLRDTIRVRPGASVTVSGWLGTTSGNALEGQAVQILTAPDDGSGQFSQAATTTTAGDGNWSARLPGGPSRLVVAEFGGTSTVEPALSTAAHIIVPARVTLSIRPHSAHWGGRIKISGRVKGGYIPPAGELVVLWVGWAGGSTEVGHLYTRPNGRFSSRYTFLRGNGTETYRFWVTTARESDYPYAPGSSRRVAVTVSP